MGRRGRTRYWEVVNTVRQYLHGSLRTALRHLTPLHPADSPHSLSKAKYPDRRAPKSAPRFACQPGCPAQQMCTEEWPWVTGSPGLYRGRGRRKDDESGLDRSVALTREALM
ncbi:hypothetical protein PAMP_001196 [Pampus punctatissimus]